MSQRIRFLIYGYTPTLAWNAALLACFSASAIVHSVQAVRTRYWIFFPTLILGAIAEMMGYAARIWSNQDVYVLTPYLLQICVLIMAPVFFSAFLYVILGVAIRRLGQQYSVLTPRMYLITFLAADLISLILQAVGGGRGAAGAAKGAPTKQDTNIMVSGIIFQLGAMAIFISCGIDFAFRLVKDVPYAFRLRQMAKAEAERGAAQSGTGYDNEAKVGTPQEGELAPATHPNPSMPQYEVATSADLKKWRWIMIAVGISSAMILLRGIFRSIELWEGWTGYLVTHEIFHDVLDGIPMVIAVSIFNVIHPGFILGRKQTWKGYH